MRRRALAISRAASRSDCRFGEVLALVDGRLALAEGHLDLHLAVGEVELGRHQGQTFELHLHADAVDLVAVQQELAGPDRLVPRVLLGVGVGRDVHAVEPGLARVDRAPRLGELHLGLPQRLDLAAGQDQPALVGVEQRVAVSSLPVGGHHLDAGLLHRTAHTTGRRRRARPATVPACCACPPRSTDEMIAHAYAGLPLEACGLFAGSVGTDEDATVRALLPDRERSSELEGVHGAGQGVPARPTATPRTRAGS